MKIFLTCLLLILTVEVHSETFRIATGEFTPYCSSVAKHKGFASHVVSEAFARQGHKVEFYFLPWKRALAQTQSGNFDATSWWAFNEQRGENFHYSEKLLEAHIHFFYVISHRPDFDWKTVDDLSGYRIGKTRGYFTSDTLEAANKDGKVTFITVNDDEQNFRLLLYGRTDLFPVNIVTGLELLRTKFAPNIIHQVTFHPRPMNSRPGFLLFPKTNKRSQEIMRIFNAGLESLRADGTYDNMFDNLLSGYYSQ
ncbi:substrate-binding periplasmic protein [Psychromonas ossibalaenae]|uniref:substrate-binding periplasmic protein n=1 Tax=Psychromonas ossibalaenae TaxID=444922 RepID=UPI00036D35FB|nr:transporter substrate-binding domain-containing protein [Psychromonas ossibalaenae]